MRKTIGGAALAVLATAAVAVPAQAASGDCQELMTYAYDAPPTPTGVFACRQDDWFHQSDQRLSNRASTVPSWDATAPASDFQSAGAAYAALRPIDMFQSDASTRPTFSGTFTGVLDNIALSVYTTGPYAVLGEGSALYTKLVVDGKTVWENAAAEDPEVTPGAEVVDDHTTIMRFAWTGLAARLQALHKANTDTTKHTITLSFVNKYYGDSNFVMLYDATEYPSGLVFNLEPDPDSGSLAGYTEIATS